MNDNLNGDGQNYQPPQPPPPPSAQQGQPYGQQSPNANAYLPPVLQNYKNKNSLCGTLMSLAIYQIVLLVIYFAILLYSLVQIIDYENIRYDSYYGYVSPPQIYLIISFLISLLVIGSLVVSAIMIFRKSKIGVIFTWVSIGLTIFNRIFSIIAIWITYNDFSYSDYDYNYLSPSFPFTRTFGMLFLTVLVIGVEIALLLVPPTRRQINESFK